MCVRWVIYQDKMGTPVQMMLNNEPVIDDQATQRNVNASSGKMAEQTPKRPKSR